MKELRVLGFPVRVHPWFFLVALLIQPRVSGGDWMLQLVVWILVMFGGVLLHELGHALASRAFGLEPRIELYGLGGMTYSPGAGQLPPTRNLIISVAGPLFGIALGALSFELLRALRPIDMNVLEYVGALVGLSETRVAVEPDLAGYALHALVWVNFGWGVLNLLPLLPLDGGHVMASLFEMVAKDRGRRIALFLSLGFAVALAFLAMQAGLLFGTLIAGFLAWSNFRGLRAERQLRAIEPFRVDLDRAYRAFAALDGRALAMASERILQKKPTPPLATEASLLLIWGRLLGGEIMGARMAREATKDLAKEDPALEAAFALLDGQDEAAVQAFEQVFRGPLHGASALRIVAAFAASGRFDLAPVVFQSRSAERAPAAWIEAVQSAASAFGAIAPSAKLGELWFARSGEGAAAIETARAYARSGRDDRALDWLERAQRAGAALSDIEMEDDFRGVRGNPRFRALRTGG